MLETKTGWKKIQLSLDYELVIEGWVDAALFEPDDGGEWPEHPWAPLGGGHQTGKLPTYCSGKLAADTRIMTGDGSEWATVPHELEGVFAVGEARHQLLNFLGPYRDSFCAAHWYPRDTQGYRPCVEDAEVRAEDVKLVCPAPKAPGR